MPFRSCLVLLSFPLAAALTAADQGEGGTTSVDPGATVATSAAGSVTERSLDAGLRFFVDAAPTHYENNTYGGEGDFDSGVRMGIMAVFRGGASQPGEVGFFGGIGLSYTGYTQAIGVNDFTLSEFGMDIQLGAYIPVAPMFEIEVGFDLGFGGATAEYATTQTDSGSYILFDFFIRPSLMMKEGLNAYLTLGYQTQVVTLTYAGYEEEYSITGGYFGAGVGFFF